MRVLKPVFRLFFCWAVVLAPASTSYSRHSHDAHLGLKLGSNLIDMCAVGFYEKQDKGRVKAFLKASGLPASDYAVDDDKSSVADIDVRKMPSGQKFCSASPEDPFKLESLLLKMEKSGLFTKVKAISIYEWKGSEAGAGPETTFTLKKAAFFPSGIEPNQKDALDTLKRLFTGFFSRFGKDVEISITPEGPEGMSFSIQVDGIRGGAMADQRIYETYETLVYLSPLWEEPTLMQIILPPSSVEYAPAPFRTKPPKERFQEVDLGKETAFLRRLANFITEQTGGRVAFGQ